jgi:orotidine-5'-phosphate decarboxylase
VVGATYPGELKVIRERYPEMPLLIPGVGTQGGELSQVVRYGADAKRQKTIINSSRQILYASRGADFATAARKTAQELRDRINDFLTKPG